MALSVFTNVPSLNAQRNLNANSANLSKALQRLSSGLRINTASDDAAGLAISTGLTAQFRGLNQAIRNAGDGLSLLGTAESAINEQVNLLQRIRELGVQSASDTNSGSNRSALNDEVTQLKAEFDRISQTVTFNGQNLLDGTFTSKDIQVGAYSGTQEKIAVDIQGTRSATIGKSYTLDNASVVGSTAGSSGDITITYDGTTYDVGATSTDGVSTSQADSSAIAFANAINEISGQTGVVATAEATTVTGSAAQNNAGGTPAGQVDAGEIKINGVDIGAVTITSTSDLSIVNAINNVSAATGVTASLDGSDKIVLTAEDGRNIQVALAGDGAAISGLAAATTHGSIKLTSYKGSFSVTDASSRINLAGTASLGTDSVATLDVATKTGAKAAIDTIDGALEQLNNRRAAIGAQVNRLNSVVNNLSSVAENVAASNSRILDADFANETATLTRTQILQQAAVAVLAQANQAPQLALSLLR
jgi:flagellin